MALLEHMAVYGNKCHLSNLLEPSDVNNRIRLVLRHMGTATNLNPTKYGQTSWPQNAHSRPPKVFPWHSRGDTPEGKKERGESLEDGGEMYTCRKFSGLGLWRRRRKKPLAFLLAHKMAAGWRPGERERG